MNKLRRTERETPAQNLLPLLHRAASLLRGAPDRRALAATLNEFMQLVPPLKAVWVELPIGAGEPPFSGDALTVPLRATGEVVGVMRHHLDGPPLDGVRLRLLGGVADLLGAILEQLAQADASGEIRALLALVLEQLPFGAACFGRNRVLLAANAQARQYGRAAESLSELVFRFDEAPAAPGAVKTRVHLGRAGDQLVLVHVHAAPAVEGASAGTVALLFDLGQQARTFLGAIARETYRALWLGRPLTLAVLEAAEHTDELLNIAQAIRARLPLHAETGPLEADAVGILAPDTPLATLRTIVRGTEGLASIPGLRLGIAELERHHRTPESLVTTAVNAVGPLETLWRPSLLVFDASPSVTTALQVALRIECEAVPCHDHDAGWDLLQHRAFDAIFATIGLDEWERDMRFLQRALAIQPGLKPFIMTDGAGLPAAVLPELPPGTPVFRKPFQVGAVRQAVREQLARR